MWEDGRGDCAEGCGEGWGEAEVMRGEGGLVLGVCVPVLGSDWIAASTFLEV